MKVASKLSSARNDEGENSALVGILRDPTEHPLVELGDRPEPSRRSVSCQTKAPIFVIELAYETEVLLLIRGR
jgi:hypothetical protein